MKKKFDLAQYMNEGIENIVKGIVKASFTNPKETGMLLGKYGRGCLIFQKEEDVKSLLAQ